MSASIRRETILSEKQERFSIGFSSRASEQEIGKAVEIVAKSPLVTAILDSANVWMLVVNQERQIVSANRATIAGLDLPNVESLLGLRPGEVIECGQSQKNLDGCGEGECCSLCGITRYVIKSQELGIPVEDECLISVNHNGIPSSLELKVRATPITLNGSKFTVVALQDISDKKRRRILERIFIHDLNNTLTGLNGWSQFLIEENDLVDDVEEAAGHIKALTKRMIMEVDDHRALMTAEAGEFKPVWKMIGSKKVFDDLVAVFSHHEAAEGKEITMDEPIADVRFKTDPALLQRILVNMTRNALEASQKGGTIKVGCKCDDKRVRFVVWNEQVIKKEVGMRIFQRSFSTKSQEGRGLGTYSMKLFGETVLGGQVSFDSTPEEGTSFFIDLDL